MPSRLGAFTELQQLELDHNDITGTIPSEIGGDGNMMLGLMSLSQLEIHDNGIWGTIPTQVGLLTNLVELQMHDNYLSGKKRKQNDILIPQYQKGQDKEATTEFIFFDGVLLLLFLALTELMLFHSFFLIYCLFVQERYRMN